MEQNEKHQELIRLVIEEAKNLRKEATVEEKSRLDFETLYYYSPTHCIYGQMTGDCYSSRANTLIGQCCQIHVYKRHLGDLRKASVSDGLDQDGFRSYFSPIEQFISVATPDSNLNLIRFIQGDLPDLKPEDLELSV